MPFMGTFWAVVGVVALFDQEHVTVRTNRLLAVPTNSWWGWAHLLGGLLTVAAGLGILPSGHRWARTARIVVAAAERRREPRLLATVVVYAVTVHGWETDHR